MEKQILSKFIKSEALKLGFSDCGIAKAEYLADDATYLQQWLSEGKHAGMSYLERNVDKRTDPRLLFENVQSVIVVLMSYYPEKLQHPALPQIAKYGYGKDYHPIIKQKLNLLLSQINALPLEKPVTARSFADSSAVLERRWAQRAGLGWLGKNCTLIHPDFGSFCFIGGLVVDVELEYDTPMDEQCGKCTLCLEACPTKALEGPQHINASKCLSYHNLESKEDIPLAFHSLLSNRVYGCDSCQDACPWNKKAQKTTIEEFKPNEKIINLSASDWLSMTEEEFAVIFAESAMKRTGLKKIQKTANIIFNSTHI